MNLIFSKLKKAKKSMDVIFYKLKIAQKAWIQFFASLKKLKKHGFNFLQAENSSKNMAYRVKHTPHVAMDLGSSSHQSQ